MSNLNNALNAFTDELKRHRRRSSDYNDNSDGSSSYSQEADHYDEHDYDDHHDDDHHCEDLDHDGICDDHDDFDGDDGCDCD